MFRTTFAAPGAPKESVEGLRNAFRSLWKDEKFLSDYERRVKSRPSLIVGDAGEKRIKELSGIDPKLADFFRAQIAKLSK
jgi:hypothetical protein